MSLLHSGSQVVSAASQWLVRAGGGRTVAPPSRLGLVALSRGNAVASSIDMGRERAPGIAPPLEFIFLCGSYRHWLVPHFAHFQ